MAALRAGTVGALPPEVLLGLDVTQEETFLAREPEGVERSNASSRRPKLETIQVGVEEPGWVLKFEAHHPVEPDVGEPHQGQRYGQQTPRQRLKVTRRAGKT